MPATIRSLWPDDIFGTSSATPIAVLREQGEALGARTHNFVRGDVETTTDTDGKNFSHSLCLVAPFLRYRKALLNVNHGVQPYPATVVETDLTRQSGGDPYWSYEVKDEHELQDKLREFFNEPRVKEILRSVINLSNDVAPPDGE